MYYEQIRKTHKKYMENIGDVQMNQPDIKIIHSENINEIAAALAKAQGKMKPAVFNKINPHFKSKYADFTSIMDACRGPLSENSIAITQCYSVVDDKLSIVSMLMHSSGQWIKSVIPLLAANTSQALGSASTYAKRYGLSSLTGVVADDDDDGEVAEASMAPASNNSKSVNSPVQKISADQVAMLKGLEAKLDKDCKSKLDHWIITTYKITGFKDLPADQFQKVLGSYQNAVKYMEQQKAENLEVAHA